MTVKRFGPILGAGISVTEEDGERTIQEAPYGVTVMVGQFERGVPDEPAFLSGKSDFLRRNGGNYPVSDCGQCALDFYKLGRGAGELITYHVTHGDEEEASLNLYTRQGTAAPDLSGRSLLGTIRALNGGKHGGQRKTYIGEITGVGDLTETTLDTGAAMVENEWAGGTLDVKKVSTKTYRIKSNTDAGVLTLEADQTLLTDWNAGIGIPANRYVLTRSNVNHLGNAKHISIEVGDGDEDPDTEFSIKVYVDGIPVGKGYNNLSTDPTSAKYWVNVINDDPSNREIFARDSYSGDKTVAAVRPANFLGQSDALTTSTLDLPDPDVSVASPTGADPVVVFVKGSGVRSQTLTGTVGGAGADIVWTTTLGSLSVPQAAFSGVATDLGDEIGTVTVTNGATVLAVGDVITITVLALEPDECIGGKVWPDVVNLPNTYFTIVDNTRTRVTVRADLDLTVSGAVASGAVFRLQYPQQLEEGCDSGTVVDSDFLAAFDSVSSTLNRIFGKNKGLVKVCTPGVTSATVQKAGIEYCAARNYMFKVQAPNTYDSESEVLDWISTSLGRSEYAAINFPSFGSTADPEALSGATNTPLKERSLVGMILGREALVAYQNKGYHVAPAGIEVTLPDILELPTGNADDQIQLNEEMLNPKGVNLVKFRNGTVILWGDRTLSETSEWKWYHQRCQMCHYENLLRENFDWIVFALNDETLWRQLGTSFRTFFYAEYTKGALRGDKFEGEGQAMELKIDSEINTDATMAAGDLNVQLRLRLADTVERGNIFVSKAGIYDSME